MGGPEDIIPFRLPRVSGWKIYILGTLQNTSVAYCVASLCVLHKRSFRWVSPCGFLNPFISTHPPRVPLLRARSACPRIVVIIAKWTDLHKLSYGRLCKHPWQHDHRFLRVEGASQFASPRDMCVPHFFTLFLLVGNALVALNCRKDVRCEQSTRWQTM